MKAVILIAAVYVGVTSAHAQSDFSIENLSDADLNRLEQQIEQLRKERLVAKLDEQLANLDSQRESIEAQKAALLNGSADGLAPVQSAYSDIRRPTVILESDTSSDVGETVENTQEQGEENPDKTEDKDPPVTISDTQGADDNEGSDNGATEPTNVEKVLDAMGFGAGFALTSNLSGTRLEDTNEFLADDGSLYVQITESQEQSVRLVAETHFLFEDISIFDAGGPLEALSDFATCGLWSFKKGNDSNSRRGCGPFIVGFSSDNSLIEEFGIGHMVSFGPVVDSSGDNSGKSDDDTQAEDVKRAFNIGYGLMFDPDSKTLDTRLLQPNSFYVRPEFVEAVDDGRLDLITKEETLGLFLMFSANL